MVVVAAALVAWLLGIVPAAAQEFDPPPVVGMQVDEAREDIDRWNASRRSPNDDVFFDLPVREEPAPLPVGVNRALATVIAQAVGVDEQGVPELVLSLGAEVPDLTDRRVDEAVSMLEGTGLDVSAIPEEADGDWVVEAQDPVPRELVGFGQTVALSLVPPLVEVPLLIGLTLEQAAAAVEASQLVLEAEFVGDGADQGTVVEQAPAPDTPVRRGSTVAAVVERVPAGDEDAPDEGDDSPDESGDQDDESTVGPGDDEVGGTNPTLATIVGGIAAVALALAVLLGVVLAVHAVRARRQRRWVRAHVRAVARPAAAGDTTIAPDRDGASRAVRLVARPDAGRQTLEEVPR